MRAATAWHQSPLLRQGSIGPSHREDTQKLPLIKQEWVRQCCGGVSRDTYTPSLSALKHRWLILNSSFCSATTHEQLSFMALISCSECDVQVSDKAMACPHCGAPINPIAINTSVHRSALPTVVFPRKSVGIAIILATLLGPLGMFYSTVCGALAMMVISLIVALFTYGLGLLITWPICILWAAAAASSYNEKLMNMQKYTR
jgi:hypothetical protein